MEEIWKPLPGWESYYSVSNLGRVRREAGSPRCRVTRILKLRPTERGYLTVSPVRTGWVQRPMMVHRLVLETFVGPPPTEAHEPNHLDGNKQHNQLENLEWATRAENIQHAYDTGLHGRYTGSQASAAKLTEEQVVEILALVATRAYRKDIAARFGMSLKMIDEIVAGAHWKHVPRPDLSGKRMGRHVLVEAQVREIKALLGTMSHGEIAARYGVKSPTIWHIANGRTWKHVT